MDSFIKITIPGDAQKDALVGLLSEYPFSGFEEDEQDLVGYLSSQNWSTTNQKEILDLIHVYCKNARIEKIPFENWNQIWEENYPEVVIDDFCRIYAPFHNRPTQKFRYEILISPQMAFGTGHHPTTEMMIRLMSHLPKIIHDGIGLDFGAGSGVLAILASRMGASHMDAVEIDPYAFQNLQENIRLNETEWISVWQGGIEKLPVSGKYHFILANVTKNIILENASEFFQRLRPGGRIIVSGILDTDQDQVVQYYNHSGFYGLESMKIGKWTAIMFGRKRK